MALFIAGAVVGQVSGRIGSNVFAKNRYGSYIRNGTVPITSTTAPAMAAKARMADSSQEWQLLTAGQRLSWKEWGLANPTVNRLGQQIHLTGHAAFTGIRCRTRLAAFTDIDDPPILPAPHALSTLTGQWDIGAGSFELAFTETPLAADEYLWLLAAVTDSPGINYVRNLQRFIGISGAAEATGYDSLAQIEAVFGTLIVDNTVNVFASVVSDTTGLLSTPLRATGVVVTTP